MTAGFERLFTPLIIGSMVVPNRLFVSGHNTQFVKYDPDGYHAWGVLSERAVHYNADRARGGFGLIMVGQTQVHPQSGVDRPASHAAQAVPVYEQLARACHEHGARVVVQLNQNGREKMYSGPDSWEPVWGPSGHASASAASRGEMSKAMDLDDIASLRDGFVRSALNVRRSGCDGVEVHAAHPHLLGEWLTPAVNRRTDQYGGSLENRLRLVLEIVAAVRAACGRDFVVGARINGAWTMPGGQTVEEGVAIASALEATGDVDFINVSGWPGIGTIGSELGHMLPWAAAIKAAVRTVPVFGIGRIVDPAQAEAALAAGHVDMVGMTRASIADPELPRKAREGRTGDIRRCIGAGQGCLVRIIAGDPMTCSQNPAVGLERDWGIGTLRAAAQTVAVTVVGGGPAGLEAAMVAAERGHMVTLMERDDTLGGQVRLIARNARRAEFMHVVGWRRRQLERLGVTVLLGHEATVDELAESGDVVVVATGSTPRLRGWYPPLPHLDAIPVDAEVRLHSVWDVLSGDLDGCGHVLVVDGTGYHQSADAVEYLLARGQRVSAVTHAPLFAAGIDMNDRPELVAASQGAPVTYRCSTLVERVTERAATLHDLQTGTRRELTGYDAVVVSIGNDVVDGLYQALSTRRAGVHRIGDCVAPRGVEHAIHEGHALGRSL
jgi:2,4-dienoyl-CoA reductase-like NADH-dependent reductase (Old Yellow Enzyme family)/thioredoxin reductase